MSTLNFGPYGIGWGYGGLFKCTLPRSILHAIGSADKSEIELFEKSSCVTPFMNRLVPSRLFRVINSVSKMLNFENDFKMI